MARKPRGLLWPDEMAFIKAQADIHRQLESLSFDQIRQHFHRVEKEFTKRAATYPHAADVVVPLIERRVLRGIWLTACIKKIPFAEGKKIYEQVQRHGQDDLEHAVSDSISFAYFCKYHGRKQEAIDHLTELKEKLLREGLRRSSRYVKALERVLGELSEEE